MHSKVIGIVKCSKECIPFQTLTVRSSPQVANDPSPVVRVVILKQKDDHTH